MKMGPLVLLLAVMCAAAAATAQCVAPWSSLGGGVDGPIRAMVVMPNGDLVVGGDFLHAGGVPTNRVARWDGVAWAPLGSGTDSVVLCLQAMPDGSLVAGGAFTTAGGIAAARIARWDGSTWSPLSSGATGQVNALALMPNGDLVAGGFFPSIGGVPAGRVARWDGTTWSALGSGVGGALVSTMAVSPTGELVVGGIITVGGVLGVGRWDGVSWTTIGPGISGTNLTTTAALRWLSNGDLLVAGAFSVAGGPLASNVARWDGSDWHAFGSGFDALGLALQPLPDGDLLVGGFFTAAGGQPAAHLARWNGSQWQPFGTGADAVVRAIVEWPTGEFVLAGDFSTANGAPFAHLLTIANACPAEAVVVGTGCSGAGGNNVLDAIHAPWLGHVATARATGLTADALAVAVFGFDTLAVPLASLHPLGLPGCELLVQDDILLLAPVVAGVAVTTLAIPSAPALGGAEFWHQIVAIELQNGDVAALTSSNALLLTIGAF